MSLVDVHLAPAWPPNTNRSDGVVRKSYISLGNYDVDSVRAIYGPVVWDYLHYADLYRSWVVHSGERLGEYGISEDLGSSWETPWYETFKTYMTIPPGQVKNFLVCIRTVNFLVKGSYKIAIRGSRAGHGTGRWHMLFIAYLLDKGVYGEIHFYDPSEDKSSYTVTKHGKTFKVHHIAEKRDDFTGFDVLIDDAYQPAKGLVPLVKPLPVHHSIKGVSQVDHQSLFLHPRESRQFSSVPFSYKSVCKCMVCLAISQSVTNYTDYLSIRRSCFELGFVASTCVPDLVSHDLVTKGTVRASLDTLPLVPIRKGKEVRAVISLREEMPLVTRGDDLALDRRRGKREYTPYIHSEGFAEPDLKGNIRNYPHLKGMTVYFSGVDPIILGNTQIRTLGGQKSYPDVRPETVAFIANHEAYDQVQSCYLVYMKGSKISLQSKYPDRKFSGRIVGNYLEMVKSLVSPPVLISGTKTHASDSTLCREFPVPYQWFFENKDRLLLSLPAVCTRNGKRIECDSGPIRQAYDLADFFDNRKYSEVKEEKVTFFPVVVEAGILIIHPQQKCIPTMRDPDMTLWKGKKTWGIIGIQNWTMEEQGGYWDSSSFCAHVRVYEVQGKRRGRVILYPEKWLDRIEIWLKSCGKFIFDRRVSVGVTKDG